MQPNMMLYTVTTIFYNKQSCTYLVEILPLPHTAELCATASLMDNTVNSTTFNILELGTIRDIAIGNQHFLPVSGWISAFHW